MVVLDPRQYSHAPLDARSKALRLRIVEIFERGGRGHVGASFSLVEILRVLYDDVLRYQSSNPEWPERDRFILSKGHGCMALYALLAEKGFFAEAELWRFCRPQGLLGGHPEHIVPGIEASTGSLGHGLSIGVGMALALRLQGRPSRVVVVVGDGECNEGSVWEAAMSAAKHQLGQLTVMVDYNKQQSYGSTSEVLELEPFEAKWQAFGFHTQCVDGHDLQQLRKALAPRANCRPHAVICHTIKGRGVSFIETNLKWHHKNAFTAEEITLAKSELAPVEPHA